MSLQTTSLVVTLSLSQWTARKLDKKVTQEVNETHGASSDAGRYNKLLANKTHLQPIQQAVNKARTFHYENTLAWGDNGDRLLPSDNYFTYVSKMNEYKVDFENTVQKFLNSIDEVKAQAKRELNGMYREEDYPNKWELESKFNFKVSMMPVSDTDFRVQLDSKEIEALKAAAEAEVNNRINKAVSGVWERVKDALVHMKEKLMSPDAVFRDSLFNNVSDLIVLLPKLNFTKDPAITDACTEMEKLLVDPASVRNDAMARTRVAAEAGKVLSKFNSFFP